MVEFTDSYVRHLKPQARRYTEYCTANDPRGFGVRVTPGGVKSFVLQTQLSARSKQVLVTLGRTSSMRLPAARRAAWAALEQIQQGKNPNAEKRAAVDSTFAALCEAYIASELASKRQGRDVENRLRADWLGQVPSRARVTRNGRTFWETAWSSGRSKGFGPRPVPSITREELLTHINAIRRDRGDYAARHAMAAVRQALNWAALQSWAGLVHSPAAGLRDRTVGLSGHRLRRQRVLTNEELKAVWRAAEKPEAGIFGVLVRLLIITAQRRDDWAAARWSEVTGTGKDALLTVPSARYKTGAVHEVPLTATSTALLRELPRFQGCDWIFTNDGRRPLQSFSAAKKKLDKASGVEGYTLHDLRRTGRTLMANLEIDDASAERVLGHSFGGGLMATYNVSRHLKAKRAALEMLEREVLRTIR